MSTPDFSAILSKQTDDIEKPKPLPVGTYLCIVLPDYKFEKVGKKETSAWIVEYKLLQAQDDVDQGALSEIPNWRERRLRDTHWLTEDSLHRVKSFLSDVLEIQTGGKSLGEAISESPGKQLYVKVGHRPSQDGQEIYTDIQGKEKV